jgi:hypothetical protein
MKYFRAEEEPAARLPPNFITGFLEVSSYFSVNFKGYGFVVTNFDIQGRN